MSSVTGVPIEAQRVSAARGVYAVRPMDDRIVAQQQEIVDSFVGLTHHPEQSWTCGHGGLDACRGR